MNMDGAVVIITGSATGLGAAVAQRPAAKGANVVINYIKSETEARGTVEVCPKLGVETLLCRADVADDADCRRMASEAVERDESHGGLSGRARLRRFVLGKVQSGKVIPRRFHKRRERRGHATGNIQADP